MGWYINLVENTLTCTLECALEIAKSKTDIGHCCVDQAGCEWNDDQEEYIWTKESEQEALKYIWNDGTLNFDCDHMEHMDYIPQVQDILKKHNAEGDVCFASEDGDNAGTSWGYRLDGEGGMIELIGVRKFEEVL